MMRNFTKRKNRAMLPAYKGPLRFRDPMLRRENKEDRLEGECDILFTHSYFLRFDPKEYGAMMPYAPLGTLYAAAYLRSRGLKCQLFDSMLASDPGEISLYLDRYSPKIVVIYDDDFNYLTKMCLERMREAAFRMTALAKTRGCTVIVHGSDPADHAESYIDHGADFVVLGEGEITLSELVSAVKDGSHDVGKIQGIAYRDKSGLERSVKRPLLHDLDTLPFPARDFIDFRSYRKAWERHGYFSTNIVTTRGCPFHCNWCAKPIYGQVYHSRSPENVIAEMLQIRENIRPDHLWFCDDIFGLKPGWVEKFAGLLSGEKGKIPFKCLSRADLLLRDDTIRNLGRAGCHTVWIGAESGSQKILDAMEKGTTIEQIRLSASQLRTSGIRVGFFLQFGYPGEDREDIDKTLRLVKECKPDEIGISVSYPLPGTPFFEKVRSELGEKQNWVDSQDLHLMFRGTYVPDFYRMLHTVTHKRFRLWQGQDILRNLSVHPGSMSRKNVRDLLAMAYHAATLPPLEAKLSRLQSKGII